MRLRTTSNKAGSEAQALAVVVHRLGAHQTIRPAHRLQHRRSLHQPDVAHRTKKHKVARKLIRGYGRVFGEGSVLLQHTGCGALGVGVMDRRANRRCLEKTRPLQPKRYGLQGGLRAATAACTYQESHFGAPELRAGTPWTVWGAARSMPLRDSGL